MNDGYVKVGAATPEIRVADVKYNTEAICALADDARERGVDLLAFPKLCLTGGTVGELKYSKALLDGARRALDEIAARSASSKTVLVVGLPVEKDGVVYDGSAVITNGEVLAIIADGYDGACCDDGIYFGGSALFRAENATSFTFSVNDRLGIISVCPVCECELVGGVEQRKTYASAKSRDGKCAVVLVNAGEGESTTDACYSGHNVIAENGRIIAESELFSTGIVVTDIDVDFLMHERRTAGNAQDGECDEILFEAEEKQTKPDRRFSRTPFVPCDRDAICERARLILSVQSNALKKRLKHTGARVAVIGISGGLDSCLALLVTVRAFKLLSRPLSEIEAVSMPCFGTTKRTKSNAQRLCEGLGVSFRTVNISRTVRSHFNDIGHDEGITDVTYENAQARERTQVLMDIANSLGGMVIGTGDLSEHALGWATFNGDHMSMYDVNCSVPKTLVRALVSYEAQIADNTVLKKALLDILDTPVSPELLPAREGKIAQITEDLVGPYELHDFFLYHFIRRDCSPGRLYRLACRTFEGTYDNATVEKWLRTFIRRFFAQQFKRSCSPDGVRVGSVSLSPRGDFAMPSDASAALWLSELDEAVKNAVKDK